MTATAVPSTPAGAAADERPLLRPPAPLHIPAEDVHPDTLAGIVLRQVERRRTRESLHIKRGERWLPVTWGEQHDSATAVAAALVHAGIGLGERVAILSENRLEWLAADSGAQLAAAVVVPIYASSTAEMVAQVLSDSGSRVVFCSNPQQAAKVAEVRADLPDLRQVVLFEGRAEGAVDWRDFAARATVDDVHEVARRVAGLQPEDTLTIIYTSGTTGVPKGVVLTHANIVGTCRALLDVVRLYDTDHGISFLPWAHVYERVAGLFAGVIAGVSASIANDLDHVGEDLRARRPTLMNGVPRVYEKMQEAIEARIRDSGGRQAALGKRAIADCTERARLRRRGQRVPMPLELRCRLWDRLVIARIRESLGGRLRILGSGGGPINVATLEFFDALGIVITEGYGLTETTGGVTANDPDAPRFGTVGRPTPGHQVRIAADGEIEVSGPGVMRGYFGNDEATAEVLQDGWFKTGDIGDLDTEGYLRITDRKKELIVTAGGKNIAPAPIEAAIARDPLVERAVVIGDRRKYLVALIVPEFGALRDWARRNGVNATEPDDLVQDAKVQAVYEEIARVASANLARYETIKKVTVLPRDLEESRGELTPTLKVKRRKVEQTFDDAIEGMYAG